MAIVINGSGTVTGLAVGGLPDGTVDAGTLATDSVTAAKLEASAITGADLPAGSVLQVVQDTSTVLVSASGNTRTEILSASITPISTSSKILISYHISHASIGNEFLTYLQRGTTDIYKYTGTDITGTERKATTIAGAASGAWTADTESATYLDSPSTTSSTTYSVEALADTGTLYVNRTSGTGGTDSSGGTSTLILMEIAG